MTDIDFERYTCQMALPGFGEAAQQVLQTSRVLIVGAGGLGCPAAQYLAAAGVGNICIADDDTVSVSNLHRQILYTAANAGRLKAIVACERLQLQNQGIKLVPFTQKVTRLNVMQLMAEHDIILDCADNFETRYLLNDAAVLSGKPVVYGAIYQFEGQAAVWNVANTDGSRSPNFRDVFPEVNATQVPNCTTGGVLPAIAGVIGCIQANEVLKYLTHSGELLAGKLLMIDALTMQSRTIILGVKTRIDITSLPQTADILEVTASELKALLENDSVQLVDIRTDQERDEFNIGGEHFELDEVEENIDFFEPGKTYVFYCSSGKRSGEAVKLMQSLAPVINAYSLKGGLGEWTKL